AALHVDPEVVEPGQEITLTWTTLEADQCVLSFAPGPAALNGSLTLVPGETTRYALTASGPGGEVVVYARVYVQRAVDYDYGNPTPAEQAHLEALNRARANPHAEAARLGLDLFEGVDPAEISGEPAQPLTFNARLHQSAGLHASDMMARQYFGHDNPEGQTPLDRIIEAGYPYYRTAENIGIKMDIHPLEEVASALALHDALFIDAGVEGRGHRVNLLDPMVREVGVGVSHGSYLTNPYSYMIVCNFGMSSQLLDPFLLGVVYDDQDADGRYTAGEGLGDVIIRVLETGAITATASAGGYGIPLPSGAYTVEAELPGGRKAVRTIEISGLNVKQDFSLDQFNFPMAEAAITSYPRVIQAGKAAMLIWSAGEANTVVIDNGVGAVGLSGSIPVSPVQTTTYTLTSSGDFGSASESVTVYVDESPDPPAASLSVAPEIIGRGETVTLTWWAPGAESVFIDQGVGLAPSEGSIQLSLSHTIRFTLTAINPGGQAAAEARVQVTGERPPQPEGSFGRKYEDLIPGDASIHRYAPGRFTLITGRVETIAGAPLPDVAVTMYDHSEYVTAYTDAQGAYTLPVQSGDETIAETIRMIAEDLASTTFIIDGDSNIVITHQSTPMTDEFIDPIQRPGVFRGQPGVFGG
ncbi:MAG: hypothetical protein GY859_00885, partial [Desulfobacterales bacterium]|nr:hypothetical protein [Desulfobacterales bacterium]